MYIIADAEWNGDAEDTIHVISLSEYPKGTVRRFTDMSSFEDFVKKTPVKKWFFHAGLTADIPVINKVFGRTLIKPEDVVDTFVVSRLVDYKAYNTHSLKEIGQHLGVYKGDYEGDWACYTSEMGDYCDQDVEVLRAIVDKFWKYIVDPSWAKAMETEHKTASLCRELKDNGFSFNKGLAEELLEAILEEMEELENSFQVSFPPRLVLDRKIQYKKKADGTLYKRVQEAIDSAPKTEVHGPELHVYTYEEFNPGSPKHRIDVLWDAGWKPFEKTKGHLQAIREKSPKLPNFQRYGWKCSEDNLQTLPKTAPEAAFDLVTWLTLEGRRSSLVEWLNNYDPLTGRIHGKFWNIGAWTGRMSHSSPNQANIPAILDKTPETAVEHVKDRYNAKMRECFRASVMPSECYLVGTDAEGIQLRILTHYMKSTAYRDAVVSGDSSLGTDIHSMNKKALGSICSSRDDAKTFIYAWLLGAGLAKIASILSCTIPQAKNAERNFLAALPDLKRVKEFIVPTDARKGFFIGLDGRRVKHNNEHKMLAGYLQNGEAVVMKRAATLWKQWAEAEGIQYKLVDFVHDEWQTEVYSKRDAERIGELQSNAIEQTGKDLGLFCPLAGKYKVGKNWKETH
jgi:DNA polymerase I